MLDKSLPANLNQTDVKHLDHANHNDKDNSNAKKMYNFGEKYFIEKQFNLAITYFVKAILENPYWVLPYKSLGNALLIQGNLDAAIRAYSKALEIQPDFAEIYANLGTAYYLQSNVEQTILNYQKALELNPNLEKIIFDVHQILSSEKIAADSPEIINKNINYLELGNKLFYERRLTEAITYWKQAIINDPLLQGVNFNIALALQRQDKLTEAIIFYQKEISINPNNSLSYLNLGSIYHKQKKIEEAINFYMQAIQLNGSLLEAHFYLANLLAEKGNRDEAIRSYKRALKINPDFSQINHAIVRLEQVQRLLETALDYCPEIISLQPELAENSFYKGNTLARQGKLDEAIIYYQKAIEIKSEFAEAYFNLGNIYYNLGGEYIWNRNLLIAAVKNYQKVIELKPNWAEAYIYLGNCLGFLGDANANLEPAVSAWKQGINLKPELAINAYYVNPPYYHPIYEAILRAYLKMGRLYEAMNLPYQALDLQKKRSENHLFSSKLGIKFFPSMFILRIGHYFGLEVYAKSVMLGWQSKYNAFIIAPKNQIANHHFLTYWDSYVTVISDPSDIKIFTSIAKQLSYDPSCLQLPNGKVLPANNMEAFAWLAVEKHWQNERRAPLLNVKKEDQERGWRCLKTLGVPQDAWFVSLHVREDTFDNSPEEQRNVNIDNYMLAIKSIVSRGGWVIRMGDHGMKPLPKMEKVVDYAHSEAKSDWMDVFLWGQCRFFLGSASGPIMIPSMFGVPRVFTNMVPLSSVMYFTSEKDLAIAKLYQSTKEQRTMTFKESFSPPLLQFQNSSYLFELGFEVIDNTPEEINDIVIEMCDRLDGKMQYTEEDEKLQDKLKSLVPDITGYGIFGRLGQKFLRKYATLLN